MTAKPLVPKTNVEEKKDPKDKKIAELLAKVDELEETLEELKLDKDSLETELKECRAELKFTQSELDDVKGDLDDSQSEVYSLERRIDELEDAGAAENFLYELVHDRYWHLNPDYDTLEKVLDRAEFVLKYGD